MITQYHRDILNNSTLYYSFLKVVDFSVNLLTYPDLDLFRDIIKTVRFKSDIGWGNKKPGSS